MLACLAILLAGCANAHYYRGLQVSNLEGATIIPLPAVAQEGNNDCGYAALASVALYHRVNPDRLGAGPVPEAFRDSRMSAADLIRMANLLDLAAFGYQGELSDLEQNVSKGRPVLALLDQPPRLGQYPGLEWWADLARMPFRLPHWVVVVGFTADGQVVLHDPDKGLLAMNRREFERQWQKRSRVAVLVMPRPAVASSQPAEVPGQ